MSLEQNRAQVVIHSWDQGDQHTSLAFGRRPEEMQVRPWRSNVGYTGRSALARRFFNFR